MYGKMLAIYLVSYFAGALSATYDSWWVLPATVLLGLIGFYLLSKWFVEKH